MGKRERKIYPHTHKQKREREREREEDKRLRGWERYEQIGKAAWRPKVSK